MQNAPFARPLLEALCAKAFTRPEVLCVRVLRTRNALFVPIFRDGYVTTIISAGGDKFYASRFRATLSPAFANARHPSLLAVALFYTLCILNMYSCYAERKKKQEERSVQTCHFTPLSSFLLFILCHNFIIFVIIFFLYRFYMLALNLSVCRRKYFLRRDKKLQIETRVLISIRWCMFAFISRPL